MQERRQREGGDGLRKKGGGEKVYRAREAHKSQSAATVAPDEASEFLISSGWLKERVR